MKASPVLRGRGSTCVAVLAEVRLARAQTFVRDCDSSSCTSSPRPDAADPDTRNERLRRRARGPALAVTCVVGMHHLHRSIRLRHYRPDWSRPRALAGSPRKRALDPQFQRVLQHGCEGEGGGGEGEGAGEGGGSTRADLWDPADLVWSRGLASVWSSHAAR